MKPGTLVASTCFFALLLVGCSLAGVPAVDGEPQQVKQAMQRFPTAVEAGAIQSPPAGELLFVVNTMPRWDEASGQAVFDDQDWVERMDRPVFAGGTTRVFVAAERFPTCGLDGRVTISLQYDDGTQQTVALEHRQGDRIAWGDVDIPLGVTTAETWLHVQTDHGCEQWDSDFGRNYRVPIYTWKPAVVHFDADWKERVEGKIIPGGVIVIDYDESRLPQCRGTYHGYPSWQIHAWMSASRPSMTTNASRQDLISWDYGPHGTPTKSYRVKWAVFPVPHDAQSVSLWFENEQYPPTCHAWDSDYGANYTFSVAR